MEDKLIGQLISNGQYRITEKIGQGGFASVYKGIDLKLEWEVAIKILLKYYTLDKEIIKRFHREAKTIAHFTHPNIIRIHSYGNENDLHFYVMDLLLKSLKDVLKSSHKIQFEQWLKISLDIARALEYAHRKVENFIHRDIKPGNILFDEHGNAILSDFGLAKGEDLSLTKADDKAMGTPKYMAPEQIAGRVSHQSDIYSFGVLMYEMATGKVPFVGEMLYIFHQHKHTNPIKPRKLVANFPKQAERIILRALEKDLRQRYQFAEQIVDDLEKLEQGLPKTPKDTSLSQTILVESNKKTQTVGLTKKQKIKLTVLISGIIAFIILVFLMITFLPKSQNNNKLKPIVSQINLASKPSGASVYLDNEFMNKYTPCQLSITQDVHRISLKLQDHLQWDTTITIQKKFSQTFTIMANLIPKPEPGELASLTITSNPSDAFIDLNSTRLPKRTPYTIDGLEAGYYSIRISKSGYFPEDLEVAIRPGEIITRQIDLIALSNLKLRGIPAATIYVNNEIKATLTGKSVSCDVTTGAHTIKFIYQSWTRDTTLSVRAGQTYRINCYFKQKVSISALYQRQRLVFGSIIIDGEDIDQQTPLADYWLPAGEHTIKVRDIDYGEGAKKVIIKPRFDDQALPILIDLEKN